MPKPTQNEPKDDFISRCIKYVMENEDLSQEEAQGRCYGIWRHEKESSAEVKRVHAIEQVKEVTAQG